MAPMQLHSETVMADTPEKRSHTRKERRMIGVREFRDTFPTLTEEVDVVRSRGQIEVLGRWTPSPRRHPAK